MKKTIKFTNGNEIECGIMYCVGSNYSKHAREMDSEIPSEPLIFLKPPVAYIESGESVKLPAFSDNVHHEVELVVIIGKDCRNIKKEQADEFIAGYAVGVDVTLRDLQAKAKAEGKPWAVAKGFHTSAPISKAIPSAIADVRAGFSLLLKVNGETKQTGNTADMERSVPVLIEYLSSVFGLNAGDIIFTGTPEGVGKINHGDKIYAELTGFTSIEVSVD